MLTAHTRAIQEWLSRLRQIHPTTLAATMATPPASQGDDATITTEQQGGSIAETSLYDTIHPDDPDYLLTRRGSSSSDDLLQQEEDAGYVEVARDEEPDYVQPLRSGTATPTWSERSLEDVPAETGSIQGDEAVGDSNASFSEGEDYVHIEELGRVYEANDVDGEAPDVVLASTIMNWK